MLSYKNVVVFSYVKCSIQAQTVFEGNGTYKQRMNNIVHKSTKHKKSAIRQIIRRNPKMLVIESPIQEDEETENENAGRNDKSNQDSFDQKDKEDKVLVRTELKTCSMIKMQAKITELESEVSVTKHQIESLTSAINSMLELSDGFAKEREQNNVLLKRIQNLEEYVHSLENHMSVLSQNKKIEINDLDLSFTNDKNHGINIYSKEGNKGTFEYDIFYLSSLYHYAFSGKQQN